MTIDLRFAEPVVYDEIDPADDEMITITHTTRAEITTWLAAGVASLAAAWLVYERLTPLSGGFGFLTQPNGQMADDHGGGKHHGKSPNILDVGDAKRKARRHETKVERKHA